MDRLTVELASIELSAGGCGSASLLSSVFRSSSSSSSLEAGKSIPGDDGDTVSPLRNLDLLTLRSLVCKAAGRSMDI